MKRLSFIGALWACVGLSAYGAPFQNLGFDAANTNTAVFGNYLPGLGYVPSLYGEGPAEDLLPGWQLFRNGELQVRIGYDLRYDEPFQPKLLSKEADSSLSVEGKYALIIGEGYSLVQRGDVPANARFLDFIPGVRYVALSVNNVELPRLPPFNTNGMFDISAYAGQNVELRFQPVFNPMGIGQTRMDSITFIVPEPSIYTLFVLGGGVFLLSWIRRRLNR